MTNELFDQLKTLRSVKAPKVDFYPQFSCAELLTSHYYRSCWYLPFKEGIVEKVVLSAVIDEKVGDRPDHMGPSVSNTDHVEVSYNKDFFLEELANAACVLLWDSPDEEMIRQFQQLGIKAFNISSEDISTAEYGNYCKLMWQLTAPQERDRYLADSHERFKQRIQELASKGYLASALFGTGPSIDLAFKYDFSKVFTHACNTVIFGEELMEHIQPDFLSAGDVVSHFGVSMYAHEYRVKLHETLQNRESMFLTTSQFGYLFMLHYPDVADKVLVCDQRGFPPNYDLLEDWSLPCLDSVFNIHMAPTCATVSDVIFILGCDGKNPDEKLNEDFWQHSTQAQLHDLVDTGHLCHPTFDVHRKQNTWTGYQNSVRQTCGIGENLYGKQYISLEPSFTVGLKERHLTLKELSSKYPFMIKH
jgi:hypothetical protein